MAITFETVAVALADATGPYSADVKMTGQQLVLVTKHMTGTLNGSNEDKAVEWAIPLLITRYSAMDSILEMLHRGRRMEATTAIMEDLPGIDPATVKAVVRHKDMQPAIEAYRARKAAEGQTPKKSDDPKRLRKAFQGVEERDFEITPEPF